MNELGIYFPKSRDGVFYPSDNAVISAPITPDRNPKLVLEARPAGNKTLVRYNTEVDMMNKYASFEAKSPRPDTFMGCELIYDSASDTYRYKEQTVKNYGDFMTKTSGVKTTTTVGIEPVGNEYRSLQRLDKDGFYSITRTKNGEIIGGYEFSPVQRKLATGFKGKVEKLGMAIATDANGCERPVLRRVGGFILNLAKKIK